MRRPGVVGVRRGSGAPVEVDGYPVLDPGRTWASLARMLEIHDLVAVADRIVTSTRWLPAIGSVEDVRNAIATVHGGRSRLREAFAEMRVGAWSRPESLLRVACLRAGLPEPVLNVDLPVGRGRTAAPDLAWPAFKVCVEYDGFWHDDPKRRAEDLERQELLADAGWLMTRIRAGELFPEPLVAVSRILRRLTEHGYRHPAVITRAPTGGWSP